MTASSDDELPALQRDVQRLLGRCLLRLQQYERLIKAMLADHQVSAALNDLDDAQATRRADTAGKTLGTLVGEFLGSYLTSGGTDATIGSSADPSPDTASISMRIGVSLPEADFVRTKDGLKELVLLRNNLVHHFIEAHDIGSAEGCRGGRDALISAYSRIDKHYEDLLAWAENMQHARQAFANYIRTDEFREWLVDGIWPDGSVFWPDAGIVRALREAAGVLATGGWADVAEAGRWITAKYPDQLPARYGCASWRQAVHESGVFDLRHFEVDGQRSARYRERRRPANPR